MRKKLIGFAFAGVASASVIFVTPAHAAPITCPPGQAATLNPADGGWVCVNQGGNTNFSEDPKNPNAGKGDFNN